MCAIIAVACSAAPTDVPQEPTEEQENTSKRLLNLYLTDAKELAVYRDLEHRQRLELNEKPVYIWQNRIRSGGQFGAVYVWTYQGCAEVVGTIFSNPSPPGDGRAVLHELHSLSTQRLFPVRESGTQWSPRAAVARRPLPDAPPPAETPRARLAQLRTLARDFSAHSISPYDEGRWELRLLPQPLYRYESSDPAVLDGAVFAYVTSAGTDPEVLLVLEARPSAESPQWNFVLARFSDFNLFVEYKGQQVWQALRDTENVWDYNKDHTYRLYTDRVIEE